MIFIPHLSCFFMSAHSRPKGSNIFLRNSNVLFSHIIASTTITRGYKETDCSNIDEYDSAKGRILAMFVDYGTISIRPLDAFAEV